MINPLKFVSKIFKSTNQRELDRLKKITESYVVSNKKIINAIGKELPIGSEKGLLETFESFKK